MADAEGRRHTSDRRDGPSTSLLREMLQQADDKHEEGHKRLRDTLRALDSEHQAVKAKLAAMELLLTQQTMVVKNLTDAPIDVGKIVFNPRMVVAVVGLAISIVAGNWFVSHPVSEKVDTIETKLDVNTKLEEERYKTIASAVESLSKEMVLRRMENAEMSKTLIALQQRSTR